MFGGLIDLFILLSFAAFILVAWKFWQQRADEKLRDNPPQRRIIEVSLPVGVSDSVANMSRFYRKAAAAALGDAGARKSGMRQIDFVYLIDVPAEGALPRMRCRIYADPDKMDAVKKALKSSFQEAIDVVELPEDDLLPIAQVLRPPDKDDDDSMGLLGAPEDMQDQPEELPDAISESSKEGVPENKADISEPEKVDASEIASEEIEAQAEEEHGEEEIIEPVVEQSTPLADQLDQIVPEMPPVPPRPPSRNKSSIDFVIEEELPEGEPPRFE